MHYMFKCRICKTLQFADLNMPYSIKVLCTATAKSISERPYLLALLLFTGEEHAQTGYRRE